MNKSLVSLPCGLTMMDYPETYWKPPETGCGGFRLVSEFFISIFFFQIFFINKKIPKPVGNRLGRFPEVSRGFRIIHQ